MSPCILTVDDSSTMRQMITFTLKSANFEVVEAGDGVEALEVAPGKKLSLIITDVNMPRMDGITLVQRLRALPEFKFTEAALGNLQLADYRNFAHGRHHWLAKRGETSSVLALVCDADRSLANRTLALIPRGIPQARLEFFGNASATAIASLIAALRVTGWAGSARGIDPGRPGVPEFGRKLYNLSLSRSSKGDVVRGLPPRDAAAIQRKTGMAPAILASNGELEFWRKALHGYRGRLLDSIFEGVVLDYDGTVVETRRRELPPDPEMVVALTRIVKSGARLAIATGRGKSIRHELQAVFPKELWPEIL